MNPKKASDFCELISFEGFYFNFALSPTFPLRFLNERNALKSQVGILDV